MYTANINKCKGKNLVCPMQIALGRTEIFTDLLQQKHVVWYPDTTVVLNISGGYIFYY